MKKIYTLLVLALCAISLNAQNGITACIKASGEISIVFDLSKNCNATAKDSLGKRTAIGFHSGANDWAQANQVPWDKAGAVTAKRMVGTSGATAKFHVTIPNAIAYYSLTVLPSNVKFVFNDGAATPGTPWAFEGKALGTTGSCEDFVITTASLATCAASSQDLRNSVNSRVAPNPFKERTYILLDGGQGKVFNVTLNDNLGRTIRSYSNVTTENLEIERGNLSTGVYFAVIRDQEGRSLTEKLVVQ